MGYKKKYKPSSGDRRRFIQEWLRAPLQTGAVAPSSMALAREVVFAAAIRPGSKVVELGPGTGAFTNAMIEAGVAEEDLILVELNLEFSDQLARQFPEATVITKDALQALDDLSTSGYRASAIVSGLPLLSYSQRFRVAIGNAALKLVEPHGRFVQFTYALKSPIPIESEYRAIRSRRIWNNLPPAIVWSYQMDISHLNP